MAALILRFTIGPMMMVHGLNKVRGPGGLEGTTKYFESLGLQPAAVHARMAATTEIGTGALLTLGAMTPMASAGIIGIMASGGWEYVGVVGAAAAAIAALGPGRFSVDSARGRGRGGFRSAAFATALGVGAAAGLLATSRRQAETQAADDTDTDTDA